VVKHYDRERKSVSVVSKRRNLSAAAATSLLCIPIIKEMLLQFLFVLLGKYVSCQCINILRIPFTPKGSFPKKVFKMWSALRIFCFATVVNVDYIHFNYTEYFKFKNEIKLQVVPNESHSNCLQKYPDALDAVLSLVPRAKEALNLRKGKIQVKEYLSLFRSKFNQLHEVDRVLYASKFKYSFIMETDEFLQENE